MSSTWRRAMLYLGLGPDEEYEDYDDQDRYQERHAGSPSGAPMGSGVGQAVPVRPVQPVAPEPRAPSVPTGPVDPYPAPAGVDDSVSAIRPIPNDAPNGAGAGVTPLEAGGSAVRPIPAAAKAKPHVVSPHSFTEAQDVADRFKGNQPVIINLQGAERDLARRLIDFASGLCYGLGGQMERVADQVYLLTPSDVEVSDEERRRLQERGLHDS
ncbi:MAG: cell division protein SepF [Acidimicrobiales bacterium]|nr:cell division protein SepF [Acidimicrobiales bacterium]MCB9373619.1 cell division protein SepF [Microthrixaceae bacterium]